MATIKSYTDIEQSKKLTKILSIESADGTWVQRVVCGEALDMPEEMQYIHQETPFRFYSGIGIPCWSLTALLECLPTATLDISESPDKQYRLHCKGHFSEWRDNPVDVCYEMILKLYEQNK